MKRKREEKETPAPVQFEEALARLEEIVKELEGSDLSLEESLARYEEGSRLVRDCAKLLEGAEQRIKTLTEGAEEAAEAQEDDREESDGDLPF